MPMNFLKVTQVARLIINTAEKLKVQMVTAKHCCLHYLIVPSAYGSREVRKVFFYPCRFSIILLVNVQLCALSENKFFLPSSADEL